MTKKKLVLIIAITTILVALFETNNAYALTTVVSIDPSYSTAQIGSTFAVDINIADVYNLYAWEFNMTFDPDILNVTEIIEGWFLSDWALTKWNDPNIQNELGWIAAGCVFWKPFPSHGADGSGLLATITFKVRNYGRSDLHFVWTKLRVWNGVDFDEIAHTPRDGIFDNRIPGDITGPENPPGSGLYPYDGKVDTYDLAYLGKKFGTTDPVADFTGPENPPGSGTYPPDGTVNTYDLAALGKNFGKHYP